jgi:proteasome assembly chaperone (PAC2) family protein
MSENLEDVLRIQSQPQLAGGTLVLAFSGWMDGGDVSTGTVERLVDMLDAKGIAEIDPESFYIYNFPGTMEVASLLRPYVDVDGGLVKSIELPSNTFYVHEPEKLVLFIGREPNLRWRTFGQCVFELARTVGIHRILFVGSFGGAVPHTREPRLHTTCSEARLIAEMEKYGVRPTDYEGPGSFVSYLMTQAADSGFEMTSLIAEIPAYLQGPNPLSIEAVTRRLAKILQLPLDIDTLRSASTKWELEISSAVEEDEELAAKVRQLEEEYDNELLEMDADEV